MYTRSLPTSAPKNNHHNQLPVEPRSPIVGGRLNNGLNRLVKVLEQKVDSQILAVQIQAYDSHSEEKHAEPRYENTALMRRV
jgi:hypothetical protein